MALIPIGNVGTIGVITDLPSYDIPPEAWTDGQNIRFRDGKVQRFMGHNNVFGTPGTTPLWMMPLYQGAQAFWLYGGLTKIYATDMSSHYNVTRQTTSVDVDYSATSDIKWNGGSLNGIGIMNNGVDDPQMWNPPLSSTKMAALTNWPASTKATVIRPAFNYFLVAMDVTESGTRYPTVLRWSHPAAPGTVPSSWDYTDPTNDSGRTVLADTSGYLLDLVMLGKIGIIYKEDSVYTMQFVGGQNIFAINPLFPDFGLIARECAKPFRGGHFVVTPDDIIVHSGGAPRSILSERQRANLFNRIDSSYKQRCFVVPNYAKSEMWFCYPESGHTQPNRALVWNMLNNALGDRQLGGDIAYGTVGAVNPGAVAQNWDADSGTWDSDTSVWDERLYDPSNTNILLARNDSGAFLHAEQSNSFNGTAFTSYVERRGLALIGRDRQGNPKVDRDVIKYVKRVIPQINGGPVQISVGSHQTPDGTITWDGPYTFDPATNREVLVNVVGPYIAIRVENSASVYWEMPSYQLDLEVIGRY